MGREEKEILAFAFEENKQFVFNGGEEKPVTLSVKKGDILTV